MHSELDPGTGTLHGRTVLIGQVRRGLSHMRERGAQEQHRNGRPSAAPYLRTSIFARRRGRIERCKRKAENNGKGDDGQVAERYQ